VGRRFESLNVIGRCARSDAWCQILADVLDRPVRRMSDPEMATSRGAALAGLVALGRLKVDEIPDRVRLDATFLPQAENRELYARLFSQLLRSYKATRPIFRRLNAPGTKT
jgi:xylulokinase